MKKIFIHLYLIIIPLIIMIVLYRSINNVNGTFTIKSILQYFETFHPFESFKEFVNYSRDLIFNIVSKFEQINNIKIANAWDVITKVFNYVVALFECVVSAFTFTFNFLKALIMFIIDMISWRIDY